MVLVGDDEDKYIDEYTEAQRIGIAIGVALAVLVVIFIIIYCRTVSYYSRYILPYGKLLSPLYIAVR